MSRNRQPNLIRCIVAGFTILSAALVLGMLWTSPVSAEPGAGFRSNPVPEKVDTSYIGLSIKQLAKQGYAIDGPSQVVEVQGNSIKIFSGQKKNLVLDLSGKTATIKDSQGNNLLLGNIAPLAKVYIARKQNDVKIFVLQKSEGRNDS